MSECVSVCVCMCARCFKRVSVGGLSYPRDEGEGFLPLKNLPNGACLRPGELLTWTYGDRQRPGRGRTLGPDKT